MIASTFCIFAAISHAVYITICAFLHPPILENVEKPREMQRCKFFINSSDLGFSFDEIYFMIMIWIKVLKSMWTGVKDVFGSEGFCVKSALSHLLLRIENYYWTIIEPWELLLNTFLWFVITLLGWWPKVCKGKMVRPCQAHSSFVLPEVHNIQNWMEL